MLTSLDQFSDTVIETDVCIAGAGPAGITLALGLTTRGVHVVLLEGGGLAPPGPDGLDLYDGEVSGHKYPLKSSRLRYFGGTSNHWGGWSRPLDAVDFQVKPHIEYSGWPITRAQLDPYYPAAHDWLQIPDPRYFQEESPAFAGHLLPDAHGIRTRYFRFSPPTRFGSEYRDRIVNSTQVQCILNANVTGLKQRGPRINAVCARSFQGRELEVRARYCVMAMGGLENARFLLNTHPHEAGAIGNHSDWLGRGFMDHTGWRPGALISRPSLKYSRFEHDSQAVMPVLTIEDQVLLQEKLINFCAMLQPLGFDNSIEKRFFDNPWFGPMAAFGEASTYRLQLIFEPSPCRNSRVTLTEKLDRMGMRKLNLNWAYNESDFQMLARSIDHLVAYLGRTGLGRLKLNKPVNAETRKAQLNTGLHHLGTTRMSADAAHGVVDADCRVFGIDNLYIAGGSVFPTVGFSNPTLTIVALACKLGDHLAGELFPT